MESTLPQVMSTSELAPVYEGGATPFSQQTVVLTKQASIQLKWEAHYWRRQHERLVEREAVLKAEVEALQATIRDLNQRLYGAKSEQSAASDCPDESKPASARKRGHRRRGGQPGHPGATRPLRPVEDVDEMVVIKPVQCLRCQAPLSGDDPTPWRHHVIEIPPLTPVVTEYQWHQLACPGCGATTRAPWPAGVPSGTYGPRVQATVALCTGAYRLSKRTTQQAMEEVFGVPMSVGTISRVEQATTEAVAAPVEDARTYVHEQAVAHLDELASRGQASVVMGGGDKVGDGLCSAAVPWGRGGP